MSASSDPRALLRAYDEQLRTEAETAGARSVTRLGPLWLARFGDSRGLVTYQDLDGADEPQVAAWVAAAVQHFHDEPEVIQVEWKTRRHDTAPGLAAALADHGFVPDEPESIMLGAAQSLAVDVPLPTGVTLRRITGEADVRAMSAMTDGVFGEPASDDRADDLLRRLAHGHDVELWVAEAEHRIVSAGRLEPVAGTDFAGIWGGATLPEWRGRGIYRALTAARARAALARGKTLLHSDSTELSRPILERSGLVKVSTTTPYQWQRPTASV